MTCCCLSMFVSLQITRFDQSALARISECVCGCRSSLGIAINRSIYPLRLNWPRWTSLFARLFFQARCPIRAGEPMASVATTASAIAMQPLGFTFVPSEHDPPVVQLITLAHHQPTDCLSPWPTCASSDQHITSTALAFSSPSCITSFLFNSCLSAKHPRVWKSHDSPNYVWPVLICCIWFWFAVRLLCVLCNNSFKLAVLLSHFSIFSVRQILYFYIIIQDSPSIIIVRLSQWVYTTLTSWVPSTTSSLTVPWLIRCCSLVGKRANPATICPFFRAFSLHGLVPAICLLVFVTYITSQRILQLQWNNILCERHG